MQILVILIVGAFIVGGTRLGCWIRQRPMVLIPLTTVAAASYYSLSVTW